MNFLCNHLNIEDGGKYTTFWYIMLHYFKKGKNATEMQKKKTICAVCGEGAVTDRTCQMWFVKFCAGDFLLDNAPQSGRPVGVDSNPINIIENNQCYAMWEIADTFKISKSIRLLVTIKNVSYFTEKNHTDFLANPIHLLQSMNLQNCHIVGLTQPFQIGFLHLVTCI